MTEPVSTLYTRLYATRGLDRMEALAATIPLSLARPAFYFLRHGQTEGNRLRIVQDRTTPLNENGLAQAARAADCLCNLHLSRSDHRPVSRIIASDMHRAWTTAGIVAGALGLPVLSAPGLAERWFGDLVGTSSLKMDWVNDPPNGETMAGFVLRVHSAVADALSGDGGDEAPGLPLLVSHGGVLHALFGMLGIRPTADHIANALPLLFEQDPQGRWRATALLTAQDPVESAIPT